MKKVILIDCDALLFKGYEDLEKYKDRIDEIISEVVDKSQATHYRCFIEDFNNQTFRKILYKGYKSKRKSKDEIVNYAEIKEYIMLSYNPYISKGVETDDSIISTWSWLNQEMPLCNVEIAANDKDYLTFPVNYLDLYHGRYLQQQSISHDDARYNLFFQMLRGDTVDSISGLKGIGEAKAKKIADNTRNSNTSYMRKLCELYKKQYGNRAGKHIRENYMLLKLRDDINPCKEFEEVQFE